MQDYPYCFYRLPMFILVLLFGVRLILGLRQFDRLYTEGSLWPKRSFTGLLIHMGFFMAQTSLLTFMAVALEADESNDTLPYFFIGLLLVAGLWYIWTWLTAGGADRPAFRYALPAGLNDIIFAVGIFGALFLEAALWRKPQISHASTGCPPILAAFIGIINVYLNYAIAVRAPDDPALTIQHVSRSWVGIGVGVIASAILVACILAVQKYGFSLPL